MKKKLKIEGHTKILVSAIIGSIIGYFIFYYIGASNTVMFGSTPDKRYGYVRVCDVNGDFDGDDNCMNLNKVKVGLDKAMDINGNLWAGYGTAVGFFVGLIIYSKINKE